MKRFAVILVLVVSLSGCSQFEGFVLDEKVQDEVVEVDQVTTNYVDGIDSLGNTVLVPVTATNKVQKVEQRVVYVPSEKVQTINTAAGFLGPYAELAGAIIIGIAGFWARNKSRKKDKVAKVLIDNVAEAIDLIDDLDKASEGTNLKKYLSKVKNTQAKYGVRDIVNKIRNGIEQS